MIVTAYAIVKNEADILRKMLDSVKDVADRIVICDTGSTDNTIEVAREYTDEILIHPKSEFWKENKELFEFDEARNFVLEHIDADSDWIISIDADEVLESQSAKQLRNILENENEKTRLLLISMNMLHDNGVPHQTFMAERIWRGKQGVRFGGGMHNWVDVPADETRVARPDIHFLHCRNGKAEQTRTDRAEQRIAMSERIFMNKIEENPYDRRSLFYLAGTYFDNGDVEKAIEWFKEYLLVSDFPEEMYEASFLLGMSYMRLNQIDKAREAFYDGIRHNWRRCECNFMLGAIAETIGDLDQAIWWYKTCTLKPVPVDPMFVEVDKHTYAPHERLWNIYMNIGNNQLAGNHAISAIEFNAPNAQIMNKWIKNHTHHDDKSIAVFVDRGQRSFIQPVIDHWKAEGKNLWIVDNNEEYDQFVAEHGYDWADIIWCEWAGEFAIKATAEARKARVIIRVHGYEIHNGLINNVNWNNVDDTIFVARYLMEEANAQVPLIGKATNMYIVHGGVESDKFDINPFKTGTKIAMACYGNYKKNIPLALQILAKLPSNYTLHIATEWQDHRTHMYVMNMIDELNIGNRVTFYEWQTDLNKFYADKDFYLSTSIEESFCYSLAEGMSAGLKPVIHNWKSANDFYKKVWIFNTVDEAVEMITETEEIDYKYYKQYAKNRLDISQNLERIDRIIEKPAVLVAGQPKYPDAFEYKVAFALEGIGYRTDDDNADIVILSGIAPDISRVKDKFKVLWYTENIIGDDEHAQSRRESILPLISEMDMIFVHHPDSVKWFEENGGKCVRYEPCVFAYYPFRKLNGVEKIYDIGFCGELTERREKKLNELNELLENKVNIHTLNTYNHNELNQFYNQCKYVLNLHCTDEPNLETRIGEAISAGARVITEKLPYDHYLDIDYIDIDDIKDYLSDEGLVYRPDGESTEWLWKHRNLELVMENMMKEIKQVREK